MGRLRAWSAKLFWNVLGSALWTAIAGGTVLAALVSLVGYFTSHPMWLDRGATALITCTIIAILTATISLIGSRHSGEVATQQHPPNIVVNCGRVREIGLNDKLIWSPFSFQHSQVSVAFIGEFTNQPHGKHRVRGADSVRARIRLIAQDLPSQSVHIDPAPWLSAQFPTMPFGPGETRELVLGILDTTFPIEACII
jgi:hypothetical protein